MESLFFKAVEEGNEGEVARLLDGDPALLEKAGRGGLTPYLLAAKHGQLGVMKLLMRRGAVASVANMSGDTALHLAALGGQEQAAAFLLGQGAQSTHREADGNTPLTMACWRGHSGVARLLLQHLGKQELKATNKEGQTALHAAAWSGDEDIVSFLLGQGAVPSSRDKTKATPFILACEEGWVGAARMLLQHVGPQALQEADDRGMTALHLAANRGHEEMSTFLISEGAQASSRDEKSMTPFMMACGKGRTGVAQMLVQHIGPEALQETNSYGVTALHLAAVGAHEETVAFLISQGAQCSSRTVTGGTPLLWACRPGHLGVVRLLLQHMGPEALKMWDETGMTALHWACAKGRGEVVRALLIGGADPTVTDSRGRTPRDIAEDEEEADSDEEEEEEGGRAGCVAAFEWYECEVERRRVLARATCLHKAFTMQRDQPTSQVPTYLEARVTAGHAVPSVEVVMPHVQEEEKEQEADASGEVAIAGERDEGAQGTDAGEEEGHAVLTYVLTALDEHLLTELLEGFPSGK